VKAAKSLIALIMTAGTVALGGWDNLLYVLLVFISLDYITGLSSAYCRSSLSSQAGLQGILKKVFLLCLVWMATCLDVLIAPGSVWIRTLVIYFMIANEGLSILENISLAGVKVPSIICNVLLQVQKQNKEMMDNKEDEF
jgi:toxin secretion/phage lysis holin